MNSFYFKFQRISRLNTVILLLLYTISYNNLIAGEFSKNVSAVKTEKPPRIDGKFDDDIWSHITATDGDFIQMTPDVGKVSKLTTKFKIAYDDHNLYISAEMLDNEPSKIAHILTRRDQTNESDAIDITIDSYHDHSTARQFSVSAAGVQSDSLFSNDNIPDTSWDAVWESSVLITEHGWNAEFRIPLTALRFSPANNMTWGLNVVRYIPRFQEYSSFAPILESEPKIVSKSAHLNNIDIQKKPIRYNILPYASLGSVFNTDGVAVQSQGLANITKTTEDKSYSVFGNAGIDAEYGINANTTLNATINPDFGQVEVDPEVINLTTFETFFEEKRPFFKEGSEIFSAVEGVMLSPVSLFYPFYSRRIGARPINYFLPYSSGNVINNPMITPILAATKLSGQNENGLSFGLLNAVTDRTFADVELDDGTKFQVMTSPLTHYGVFRLKQNVGGNSHVGGLFTATNRTDSERDGYLGMLDAKLRNPSGKYELTSFFGITSTQEFAESDYDYGVFGATKFAKIGGKRFTWDFGYSFASKNAKINDLGWNAYTNNHYSWLSLYYLYKKDRGFIRSIFLYSPTQIEAMIEPSEFMARKSALSLSMVSKNFFVFTLNTSINPFKDVDPYASRIKDRFYKKPERFSSYASVATPTNKALSGSLSARFSKNIHSNASILYVYPGIILTLGEHFTIDLSAGYSNAINEIAWASLVEDPLDSSNTISVFGERNYKSLDASLTGTVTFSTKASLQIFSQLLTGNGTYSNYKALGENGLLEELSFDFDPQKEEYASYNPDFRMTYFQSNVIYRWEYKPGSTVYAVWTHSRNWLDGNPQNAENKMNITDAFKKGSQNAFMIKFNYRFGR